VETIGLFAIPLRRASLAVIGVQPPPKRSEFVNAGDSPTDVRALNAGAAATADRPVGATAPATAAAAASSGGVVQIAEPGWTAATATDVGEVSQAVDRSLWYATMMCFPNTPMTVQGAQPQVRSTSAVVTPTRR